MTLEEVNEYINTHLNENVSFESIYEQVPRQSTMRMKIRYRFRIVFAWEKDGVKLNYARCPKREDIIDKLQGYVEDVNKLST